MITWDELDHAYLRDSLPGPISDLALGQVEWERFFDERSRPQGAVTFIVSCCWQRDIGGCWRLRLGEGGGQLRGVPVQPGFAALDHVAHAVVPHPLPAAA